MSVFLHFLPSLPLYASVGTEGASFLEIPVGAAPAAMGSAYSALADNAYAPTWNPAGLGYLAGPELAAEHLAYVEAMRYEYASFVAPLPRGPSAAFNRGLGVSYQGIGTGDIPRTDVLNGQPVTQLGSFSSQWAAYNVSYGQTVTEKLSLGLAGKYIHAQIDDVSASAYAFDLGSLYRVNDRLSWAATVANIGTRLKFINTGDDLPLTARGGVAYRAGSHWLVTGETAYRKTGMASIASGAQWQPMPLISLRAGYKTDNLKGLDALAGLTTGIGLQILGQELAYAWVPYGELGYAQYISLLMRFGDRRAAENLIQPRKSLPTAGRPLEIGSVPGDLALLQQLAEDQ